MELLIMAAGIGSRFGGLKQITPMGPNDEFIIDYSIFDAIKAGFTKVVFVIKEEHFEDFKETIGKRVEPHIQVEYVFQKIENIPAFVKIPETRIKPWGTAQAIYCAKEAISENFLVINADDFYGRDAFLVAKEFLETKKRAEYATIGYKVINTMTENGSVKRGVIGMKEEQLDSLVECSIEKVEGKIIATPLVEGDAFEITDDTLVSMNLLAFDTSIFANLEEKMDVFFRENENSLETCEFLIPNVLSELNKEGKIKVKVLNTEAVWYGVTYLEDKENVKNSIKKLVEEDVYPKNLWR